VSYVNALLTFLLGFCSFFGTIRFLHLCRLSSRLSLFAQTLRHAREELLSFSMMFFIVFASCVCLFYLLFNAKLSTCSSLVNTVETLFQMTLLQFDAVDLKDAASFLGPFCFSLFILLIVFVCLSMIFRSLTVVFVVHEKLFTITTSWVHTWSEGFKDGLVRK
jgi:hypothetical protein